MPKKSVKPRALRALFESIPLGAFDDDRASDPMVFMPVLFGPETTVEPLIHVAEIGTWVSGWTVVTTLPNGQGTHAFVVREYDGRCEIETEWANLSRGRRINVLTASLSDEVWSAVDRSALAGVMVSEIGDFADDDFNFDTSGALNEASEPWVLRHLVRSLPVEAAEVLPFLLGLAHDSAALERATMLVDKVENVLANEVHADETEALTEQAVRKFNGVTLKGAQLERLRVPGALMTFPYETWPVEVDRLVAVAYQRGDLDERFFPQPEPPVIAPARTATWPTKVDWRFPLVG